MKKILVIALVAVFALSGLVFASNNEAYVNQTGDENDAGVGQFGTYNYASISQEQFRTEDGRNPGHEAEVNQYGHRNTATVSQTDGRDGQVANVWQEGDDNITHVSQTGWWHGSKVDVTQVGYRNYAIYEYAWVGGSGEHTAGSIYQLGNDNEAYQYVWTKTMRYVKMLSHQIGDSNYAIQEVENSVTTSFVDLDIKQYGDDNIATQFSSSGGKFGPKYTTATIYQEGNANVAHSTQDGSFNKNAITQINNNNYANVNQAGSSNKATITQ